MCTCPRWCLPQVDGADVALDPWGSAEDFFTVLPQTLKHHLHGVLEQTNTTFTCEGHMSKLHRIVLREVLDFRFWFSLWTVKGGKTWINQKILQWQTCKIDNVWVFYQFSGSIFNLTFFKYKASKNRQAHLKLQILNVVFMQNYLAKHFNLGGGDKKNNRMPK